MYVRQDIVGIEDEVPDITPYKRALICLREGPHNYGKYVIQTTAWDKARFWMTEKDCEAGHSYLALSVWGTNLSVYMTYMFVALKTLNYLCV